MLYQEKRMSKNHEALVIGFTELNGSLCIKFIHFSGEEVHFLQKLELHAIGKNLRNNSS